MINTNTTELLKTYVPIEVKRRLESAAKLAGEKTSSLVAVILTVACESNDYEIAISYLETVVRLEDEKVRQRVAARLAKIRLAEAASE